MGPTAGLDECGKSRPHRDSIPDRPARSQSLYRLSYTAHGAWQCYEMIFLTRSYVLLSIFGTLITR